MSMLYDSNLCARCRGKGLCGKPCSILARVSSLLPKPKDHFSGSSPPEIFVGRYNYPEINTGILAPEQYGATEAMSLPELWHKQNLQIPDILAHRSKLIYSRFKAKVKDVRKSSRFLDALQEISIASKSVSTEVFLKKPFKLAFNLDKHIPLIGNPAPLKSIRLEENPHVEKKVDYLVNDTDNKASSSMQELHKSGIRTSDIIKILSAGLLGLKKNRKLVPTRWSVTATDDTISKFLLTKIRYYQEIGEILVFHGDYVGNHYEFLMLPDKFSFEVIEAYMKGSTWNPINNTSFSIDFESFSGRRYYAESVTGAYYTARLVLCEYLERIKRQCSCLVLREERPEYNAPLGVGILRELGRAAFEKSPERFSSMQEALKTIQSRMLLPVQSFLGKSWLIKNYGKQTRLNRWI